MLKEAERDKKTEHINNKKLMPVFLSLRSGFWKVLTNAMFKTHFSHVTGWKMYKYVQIYSLTFTIKHIERFLKVSNIVAHLCFIK